MGLLQDIILPSGIDVKNAYFRVENFGGNNESIDVTITAYLDRQAFLTNKSSLIEKSYVIPHDINDDALNIVRQVYAYLKEKEGFQDAVDVLEEGQTPLESEQNQKE